MSGAGGAVDLQSLGRLVAMAGLAVVALGVVLYLAGRLGLGLRWLPGDMVVRRPGFTLYFPVVTCLVVSVVATAVMYLIALLRR